MLPLLLDWMMSPDLVLCVSPPHPYFVIFVFCAVFTVCPSDLPVLCIGWIIFGFLVDPVLCQYTSLVAYFIHY